MNLSAKKKINVKISNVPGVDILQNKKIRLLFEMIVKGEIKIQKDKDK